MTSAKWQNSFWAPSSSKGFWNYFVTFTYIVIFSVTTKVQYTYQYFGFCENVTKSSNQACRSGRVIPIPPEKMNTLLYDNTRCYCDSTCLEYGDCCPDFVDLQDKQQFLQDIENQNPWKCHELMMTTLFKPTHVYMIGSCPPKYGVQSIARRCTKNVTEDEYHFSLDFHVLSDATNITYVNVYCAECNGENLTNLHPWKVHIQCNASQKDCMQNVTSWKYVPGKNMWTFQGLNITISISDTVNNYYETYSARRCRKEIIGHCPDNWTRAEERQLCASHALHVMSLASRLVYKNKYCAICHNETGRLICPYYVAVIPEVKQAHGQLYSYAELLSFHKKENNQLCDSLQNICVDYVCGVNFDKDENGQCVLKSEILEQGLNDSCPKVLVRQEVEFIWLNNGSIYVNSTNQIYNPKDYEMTTNSTVLICADESWMLWEFSRTQAILSTICATLSLICLSAHIAAHIAISQLRNLPGKIILCLSVALFIGQLCFEIQGFFNKNFKLCLSIAVIMHYCFLTSFFWMNVMAIDVYYTFTNKTSYVTRPSSSKQFLKYSIYAWCMPAIIVILSLLNDFFEYIKKIKPMYHNPLGACWLNNQWALLVFFAVPLAIVLLENIFFFTMAVIGISKTSKVAKMARSKSVTCDVNINLIVIYIKLAVIMGLTWISGFIAMLAEIEFLWYLFIVCNALQGVFIFMAFTCKLKVCKQLKHGLSKDTTTITNFKSTPPSTPLSILKQSFRKHSKNSKEDVKL